MYNATKNVIAKFNRTAVRFSKDQEGAQIIEYALIIAVVSLVLILALKVLGGTSFATWITRVGTCLTASCV
jgi:pilus assembly protein Flp/PilA